MSATKCYLEGAKLTVRYYCGMKPVGKKGEPLNDYIILDIPLENLSVFSDPCCGRYDDEIRFDIKCPACKREHSFDLLSIDYNNKGIEIEKKL